VFIVPIEKELECLKWNLWHGNVHKALQIVEDLEVALDLEEKPLPPIRIAELAPATF
jgi:hypothetical protein